MAVLKQARFLRGTICVELQEQDRLRLTTQSLFESRAETYNLFDLSEKFDRQFKQPLQWGIAALVAAFSAIAFASEGLSIPGLSAGLATAASALVALGFVAAYLYHCVEFVVLRHRISGDVVCKIWLSGQSKESAETVDTWLTTLREQVHAVRVHPEANNESRLAAHKDALEFLLNEDVLSAEDARGIYERSKNRMTQRAPAKLYAIK